MIWCFTDGAAGQQAGWALRKIEVSYTCVIKPQFPGHPARSVVTVPINSVGYDLLCWYEENVETLQCVTLTGDHGRS
jgi:hypothetical protein